MLGKRISGKQNKIVLWFKKSNAWDSFKLFYQIFIFCNLSKNQRQYQEAFPNTDNK